MENFKHRDTWVFDLDNTLYPASSNLFAQVDVKMKEYISQYLGVDLEEARKLQKSYFRECGTTLRGLMTHHDMDPAPYLAYVHNIDLSVIEPAQRLNDVLGDLPGRKVIFTNASVAHAERVMNKLGIERHFDGIFDIVAADYQPKPEPAIYTSMLAALDVDPARAVMVEDMARNLKPAADLGMKTLWVETEADWAIEGAEEPYIHARTDNLAAWFEELLK